MSTHKDLDVWKEGIDLVKDVYRITANFPRDENYGLISQMRRCSISVPSNIAEGAARNSSKEYVQFLYIALGSLSELETQLILSKELGFINEIRTVEKKVETLRRKLLNFIKYVKTKTK